MGHLFKIKCVDSRANVNILAYYYFCLLLFEDTFISFLKIKSQKESQNSRNQGFSYYFCMMIGGSGSGAGSKSIPLTNGSGSGSRRPKNRDPDPEHCQLHSRWCKCKFSTKSHETDNSVDETYNKLFKISLATKSYFFQL
jgi:hypothetical protein